MRCGRGSLRLKDIIEKKEIGAIASDFELSSDDKCEPVPTLSVFDSEYTTPEQASELTSGKKVIYFLNAGEIRQIDKPTEDPKIDIIRTPSRDGSQDKPGSNGHCGITNLKRPPGYDKKRWKERRYELARLALNSIPREPLVLSHD